MEAALHVARDIELNIQLQLQTLHALQTLPFQSFVSDYLRCLQQRREQEVRAAQLDKEAAELRDEVSSLEGRVRVSSDAASADQAAKADALRSDLLRAQAELAGLYRERSRALEDALAAQREAVAAKGAARERGEEVARQAEEIKELKARLSELSRRLDAEHAAAVLAAAEAEGRVAAKEEAEEKAARLTEENSALLQRLMTLKSSEAERLNEINRLHEEALEHSQRVQSEAAADRQLVGLLQRRGSSSADASRRASGAGGGGAASLGVAAGVAAAAAAFTSLKQKMGLPEGPGGVVPERALPSAPARSHAAHRGGCTGLSLVRPGHMAATCGMDRLVESWDLTLMARGTTYQGAVATINDVAYTCDGRRLLAAGTDKRILLWDAASGQVRHTLTGHSGAVTCVAASPLDAAAAVSCSEDRCLKVWDLGRGYATRTLPCAKMPNALCLSADGSTILTGHMDGTLCLWDMRQSRAGSQPLAEVRDHTQAILCIAPTASDGVVLTVAKDHALRLWDYRTLSVSRIMRAPAFTAGAVGSIGRTRCTADVSADGRWAAAGAADGAVYVWDLRGPNSGPPRAEALRFHKEGVVAAGWSSDCTTLVTGDKSGVVAFWQCR